MYQYPGRNFYIGYSSPIGGWDLRNALYWGGTCLLIFVIASVMIVAKGHPQWCPNQPNNK